MKDFKTYLVEGVEDSWTKDAELLKLTRQAMAAIAGSQRQKELIKQVNVLRKKHGLEPLKESDELDERCWSGYKPTPGKKPYEKGSCMKEDDEDHDWQEVTEDAEHDGKKVTLNKPFRTPDGPKKFAVYVKNDKGNVVKVTFGDPDMEIKRDSEDRRANFRARHNCDDPGPKDKARYWSCKMWSSKPVSKIAEASSSDVSSAAKLFQRFLRSTGAPDKVTTFSPKNVGSSTVYVGKSTNSKFDYSVDVGRGTVTATPLGSFGRQNKYVWDEKTGQVKMAESVLSEESPPDADIEKWIKDNKESFKQKYGSEKGLEVLYATAWGMYNNK